LGSSEGFTKWKGWGQAGHKTEHMKQQLRETAEEEENSTEGSGTRKKVFVQLIQTIWDRDELPQQMSLMVVVILIK